MYENPNYEKAEEVGTFISESLFHTFTEAYQTTFPQIVSSCTFPSSLISKVLNLPGEVAGIRFMFGLRDAFNPN